MLANQTPHQDQVITVRLGAGTYTARARGVRTTASSTISAEMAAQALATKLGLELAQLDLFAGDRRAENGVVQYSARSVLQQPVEAEVDPGNELDREWTPPQTLKGLKRLATKIKRERGIIHAQALELSAQRMGYPCYKTARIDLEESVNG
ncbi:MULTISPECIES: hypothetical protein [Pseudomonas]|uniref:hypothetical protein n=1 Tax=Pseudomonas TaxID=286 RepID=UPI0018A52485|nr:MULTISPECIES: hypothetical protein [Pseudomonas]BBV94883.1 hypothetical protein STW0522PSE72_02340 [Pseudomonas monteilii]